MVEVRKNPPPEAVRQAAQHVLFVEGQENSIDREAMNTFLGDLVRIEPLGSSFHLANAAQALYPFHATYYFLIDRDHHSDADVQRSWDRFPDPATHNLLIWPRRELENYFLIPEFLLRSQYLNVDEPVLRATIRRECQRRLYRDAVNQVITWCRETLKRKWIEHFDAATPCDTRDTARQALCDHPAFADKRNEFADRTTAAALAERFTAVLDELTGGHDPLEFGHGRWLELLRGKEVLPAVVRDCFKIPDATGRLLQGSRKELELARELLRLPPDHLPDELQRLRTLIAARLQR
jgi:hypothetical protein